MIVLNDDHNTFDHVAKTLSRVIPGVSLDGGYRFADTIHSRGQAAVWTGPREPAELSGSSCSRRGSRWLRSTALAAASREMFAPGAPHQAGADRQPPDAQQRH